MNAENANFLPVELMIEVDEVDDQHAELFARLAHLKDLCIEKNGLPVKEADELFAALCLHCDTEERLANEAGIDFAMHAFKHQKMLRGIYRTLQEVREERMDVFSLIRFIEYWFERHIIEDDKPLGVQLQSEATQGFQPQFGERSMAPQLAHAG